ncbi:polysaccharide deacetylase family protein [bacterium LRH843]|nr:polysaccharide deacetylase family protein [bacterium LRH843]
MKRIILFMLFVLFAFDHSVYADKVIRDRTYYEKKGDVVWDIPTKEKLVAITFDDGPDATFTNQILEILKGYNAKATFFVVGDRVKKNPDILKRMASEGYEIANHTFSHPNLQRISEKDFVEELTQTEEAILAITGKKPTLFRPPLGYYDDDIVNKAKEFNYLVVMWSWHQDTYDWRNPGVHNIVNKVLTNIRNGDIILFHDYGGNRSQTVQAVKIIMPELVKRGYHFVTVSELLQLDEKFRIPLQLPTEN